MRLECQISFTGPFAAGQGFGEGDATCLTRELDIKIMAPMFAELLEISGRTVGWYSCD